MNIVQIEEDLHIRDYINVLHRRRGVVILVFLAVFLAVIILSFTTESIYRATLTLLIDMESPNVLTASGVVALGSQHYYSYKEYYQSQKEIITSLSIIQRVFDEYSLADLEEYKRAQEPLKKFLKTLTVEPVRDTRLIRLNVDNSDPVLARDIANRIAEIYVKRNLYYISRAELMNLLKNEYLRLEARLSEYTKIYKHKHPKMIRLKQEMSEMAGKIEKAKKITFETELFGDEVMKGDYKYAIDGLKANNISIQDYAQLPIVPIRPNKKANLIIGFMIGLFGGIGMALFVDYLDDTVKEADDIARLTNWPFLGNIPDINKITKRIRGIQKYLLVNSRPKDPIAEAYRSIRTSVLFSSTKEHAVKSLAISSPGPQEGKTMSACNFAIAMAQSNRHVLLVDADMRKPSLHTIFKKKNEKGLSSFLSRLPTFEDLVHKTQVKNLFLITSGPHPANPSELISSYAMERFIQTAKKKFDIILFDTPPIAVVTDAFILSQVTDGLIMVVESGRTSKRVLPKISHDLKASKSKVVGVILNKMSMTKTNPYYGYYSLYYGK